MSRTLADKRVLITCADRFMGPVAAELFAAEGATVIADERDLTAPSAPAELIAEHGCPDVLLVNLAAPSSPNSVVAGSGSCTTKWAGSANAARS